jgi:glycine hydroxymethyltransferase
MKTDDMRKVAKWIVATLGSLDNETRLREISREVEKFAGRFPLFAW